MDRTSSDYPLVSACPPDLGGDKVCCELGLLSAFPPPPAISKNLNRQSSVKKCTSSSPVRTGDWVYWSRKGKSPQAASAAAQHSPNPSTYKHLPPPPFLIVMSLGGGAAHFKGPAWPMSSDITPNDNSTSTYLFISVLFCSHFPILCRLCLCVPLTNAHILALLLFDHVIQSSLFNGF